MVRRRLRRFLNHAGPDGVIPYRAATLGLVVVSVTAAVLQQAVPTSAGIGALVLVPVGYVFSYFRRSKRNVLLKIILALALLLAFGTFVATIRSASTVDETRAPLVGLFLWVQVLHSFDLPRPRDLTFSVAASVALIALAGSLSFSSGFIILVLVYTVLLVAALIFGHEAELRGDAEGELARELRVAKVATKTESQAPLVRAASGLLVSILVATGVVFVFIPRLPGTNVGALPFALGHANALSNFTGGVVNPGRRGGGGGGTTGNGFDPHAYFGYGQSMNLRVRGRLSNELVMRVRTPRPALYRAQAYDTYRDGRWTESDRQLVTLFSRGLPSVGVPHDVGEASGGGEELVQTFYIERELPNLVFHAYRAREVYSSSTRMRADPNLSLRLPFILEQDTIYSVVSDVPAEPGPEALAPDAPLGPQFDAFLQVPDALGSRFTTLARRITDGATDPVAKAHAVERWLRTNKRYRLDIPRDPPGKDPVDVFVFDRKEGFCEQIASTMALMLRASGVPTRLVTGFGEGERNLFTGYWEVRNSDAHAWVEVYMPGYGWVTYDPTFGVPRSSAADTTFVFKPLARAIGKVIPVEAIRSLFASLSRIAHVPRWAGPFIVLLAMALTVVSVVVSLARRRRAKLATSDRVVLAWLHVERSLKRRGYSRAGHETVIEFAERCEDPDILVLAQEFGRLRYGRGPSEEDVAAFEERVSSRLRGESILTK